MRCSPSLHASRIRWVLPCLAAGLLSREVRASGFHIDEQDARATGRAGAIIASTRGASAVYYNPAGIAQLEGWNVGLGASFVAPRSEFAAATDGTVTEAVDNTFALPHAYVSYRINDVLALGVGANAPFGLGLEWPETSPGRAAVRKAQLQTFFLMQVLALDASAWVPGLAFGVGLDIVPASVRLERDILFGQDVGNVALSGTALGVGGRAGVSYRPPSLPGWSFGATYRSPVQLDFAGNADFDASPTYRASLPPDGSVKTSVRLPQTIGAGVAFRPIPEWELELDGSWRGWSSYDSLSIELPDGSETVSNKDWRDAFALRIGTEYTLAERWSARLGFIWDQTPVPATTLDFQLPDANRIDISFGVGALLTSAVRVDVAALHVLNQERQTASDNALEPPIKGEFGISAWVVGVSLGVAFDAGPSDEPDAMAVADPPVENEGECARPLRIRAHEHLSRCER